MSYIWRTKTWHSEFVDPGVYLLDLDVLMLDLHYLLLQITPLSLELLDHLLNVLKFYDEVVDLSSLLQTVFFGITVQGLKHIFVYDSLFDDGVRLDAVRLMLLLCLAVGVDSGSVRAHKHNGI